MAQYNISSRIILLNDTKANWDIKADKFVLLKGEIGIESDTKKFKIGDGVSTWAELDYSSGGTDSGDVTIPTKLADLLDDETHRTVTDEEKTTWNNKLSAIPSDYKTKTENDGLYQPKGNYLTSYTETDPTVPNWAKQATKPSYTANEVGALPNTTSTLPNPHSLTIKQNGETKGTYNGSSAVEIDLEAGGDSGTTTIEQLWLASGNYDSSTGTKTLSSPYTNYKFIILVWGSSGFGCYQTTIVPVNYINTLELSNRWGTNFSGTSTLRTCYGRFTSTTQFYVDSANNAGLKAIIGIK